MSAKLFCVSPFIRHYVSTQASAEVCCESQRVIRPGESPSSDWHSPQLKRARHLFNQGEWPPDCEGCRNTELKGGRSLRQIINAENPEALEHFVTNPTTQPPPAEWYDVRMNNTCNLACVMCGAEFSSLHHSLQGRPDWIISPQHTQSARQMLINAADDIQCLQLAGGEPMVMPGVCGLLTELADQGHSDHIDVEITTNLTRVQPKWFDHTLSRYRSVRLQCSQDAVGDRAEYVRWPLSWAKWSAHCDWVQQWCATRDHCDVSVAVTVSAVTLSTLHLIHTWLEQHSLKAEYSVVQDPEWLQPNRAPLDLIESVCEWIDRDRPHPDLINRVLPHLRSPADHSDDVLWDQWTGIEYLDQHRPRPWCQAVPELAHWSRPAVAPHK